ncbi:type I polyketide synthase [Myxococcus sp. RHSTA-1-4]|uniref:type I polyketide synthase n=1 Tax=Myxococcus sp. RHSTA-1-4 TaxID=2874601 RepID=UPI001CBB6DDC|nr:type I polyketide synthase [Myxococcus sp. RHSTA-1-4]MBZ4417132.1 acyltransferase domain-containing protein [Myxococcus sp. RHSTA-1-4]
MSDDGAMEHGPGIAIVGMSGCFPGAPDVRAFWRNLRDGVEGITRFTEAQLREAGVPEPLLKDPAYVKAGGVVEGIDRFDAGFFGYSPSEARRMDPQHRRFLECAWEALERAGHPPERFPGAIGVYAGASANTYLLNNLLSRPGGLGRQDSAADYIQSMLGNAADFLPTRVSYKLDLRGPSLNVQTACSTSLTAIVLACQSLMAYQCDLALAGGVSIRVPNTTGYLYQEGGILSPDGHCRAFDAEARGTVPGNGWGVVVLRRLEDALADGDHIHAVLRGWALNNDGAAKVGFTAPSVEGQAEAIATAHAVAGVGPEDIDYVEAHGTGTALGDPIEVEALTQVFRAATERRGFCGLGSVKSGIGHLDSAAGVAGLIKTVLALEHRQLPPTLHVRQPHPRIGFEQTPFHVNTTLRPWERGAGPRRAGVSAFGIGGTNAHVVLEEAPEVSEPRSSRRHQLLVLSARAPEALETARGNLQAHLSMEPGADPRVPEMARGDVQEHSAREPGVDLGRVAWTLQVGRRAFAHRGVVVARDAEEARGALGESSRFITGQAGPERPLVFLFPGGGAQHVAMGRGLYEAEPAFRAAMDRCAKVLASGPVGDLRARLYADGDDAAVALRRPSVALPALFATEYSLATLLGTWGLRPSAMLGHSLGEYVAACLSGVLTLEDALALVALRGRLFERLAPGAMLSAALPEAQVRELLGEGLSLAAINGPALCTLSGTPEAIDAVERTLRAREVECRRLHLDVAAHSSLLEPILPDFGAFVRTLRLSPPGTPFISNVTGTWARAEEVTDPRYWVRHLREPVRFAQGVAELARSGPRVFLEVGPGHGLANLARLVAEAREGHAVLSTMRHPQEDVQDDRRLLEVVGRLWTVGVNVDWSGLYGEARPRRTPLPTYPFQRQRYWVDAPGVSQGRDVSPAEAPAAEPVRAAPALEPSRVAPVVALRTATEHRVAEAWRSLLGVESVGPHDNFFELGGHSLLALLLMARLKDLPGAARLTLRALLQAPTVAGLAALLDEGTAPTAETRGWVPLHPGRAGASPLFLSHAAGGHLLSYEPLARRLGEHRPVYGFEAVGLSGEEAPPRRLEDLAARQVEALLAEHPHGPYLLGGSSLGGATVFEMAHQLLARGHEVHGVFMLDTPGPEQGGPEAADEAETVAFALRLKGVGGVSPEDVEGAAPGQRLAYVVERGRAAGLLPGMSLMEAHRAMRVLAANMRALREYRPRPLDVPVFFFRAREQRPGDPARDALPWFQWAARGMEVHSVPGDHDTLLLPPNVDALARVLEQCIQRVEAPSRRAG